MNQWAHIEVPNVSSMVITWDTGGYGIANSGRTVRNALGDYVDEFLNAYFEANPK